MQNIQSVKTTYQVDVIKNHQTELDFQTVHINKDQWLGTCLDDCLFKLCGTDQVVWVPQNTVQLSQRISNAFEVKISLDGSFCCAKIVISNSIRMCLVDQHQVRGFELINYLQASNLND
jgi:hypothetical protein